MQRTRTASIALLAALSLAACGSSEPDLESWEMDGLRGDAYGLAAAAASTCVNGDYISWGETADKLLDLNEKLPDDPKIRDAIRSTAESMRTCGDKSQADRLNRATD